MILTRKQASEMLESAKPLMKWMIDNCHPHCTAMVDSGSVELNEEIALEKTDEFIKD